jgi:pimeloyl-ACP methyl ester carboxylesterase
MKTDLSTFTSDKARDAFATAYASLLDEHWPARRAQDVPTSFGTTRAYRQDGPAGPPFVLLPGGGGNALMWHRYFEPLARHRPVIAIDPVGEPGGSTQTRPFAGGGDAGDWLEETLAGLGVASAHVIGCSYGGWLALQHALHHPGRAATLTLLDPAGFGRIGARFAPLPFVAWVIAGGLAGLAPRGLRHRLAGPLRNATLRDDVSMRMVRHVLAFRRRVPAPEALTDAQVQALAVPTLLLLGEHSQLYAAAGVAARVTALNPLIRAELVEGAGHDVPTYAPARVIERAAEFAHGAEVG